MDERSFDALLRLALMDANLERFRTVLDGADDAEPVFSAGYLRQRMKLLADPFGWVRKTARPLWKKTLQSAACVLLACTVALGALMAVSPTVRAAVLNWLREISGGHIAYTSTSDRDARDYGEPPAWRPTWLPEGWSLDDLALMGPENGSATWTYRGESDYSLTFHCWWPQRLHAGVSYGEDVDAAALWSQATVWGKPADFYSHEEDGDRMCYLFWESEDGMLFRLGGDLDREVMERIADSVTEIGGETLPEYRLGWTPEDCVRSRRNALRDVTVERWNSTDGTILGVFHWMYAAETAGSLAKPEGTAEAVRIGDVIGCYWGPPAPDAGGSGIKIQISGSSGTQTMTIADEAQKGTVLWTDPETGITFRISGDLEKDDLLRMAESVAPADGETP